MKVFICHAAHDRAFIDALSRALRNAGHDFLERQAEFPKVKVDAAGALRTCDAVVVVLSDDAPNLYFELGVAFGAQKNIVIVASSTDRVPNDAKHLPFVQLSNEHTRDASTITRLLTRLEKHPSDKSGHVASPDATLRRALKDPQELDRISANEFETLVATLLVEKGFTIDVMRDHAGADLCARPIGDHDRRILVEVKKRSAQERASIDDVKQLIEQMVEGISLGMLVTTFGFTPAAVDLARSSSIVLITLEEFLDAKTAKELLSRGARHRIIQGN